MPFELASRTLAQLINYGSYDNAGTQVISPTDCTFFIGQVTSDADLVSTICLAYPFTDITSIRMFVGGTWNGDETTVETNTGLTAA